MSPEFAKAVDPVFMDVLSLLEKIERGESPDAQDQRLRITARLQQAEAKVGRSAQWQLAKYALASWIDEVLLDAPWAGRDWWENNALEVELFGTRLRNEQFYIKAQEAGSQPQRDALEVFYLCAVLGFRGLYRDAQAGALLADARGLPANLDAWAKQTAAAIRLGQGRPPLGQPGPTSEGAPPLSGRALLIWSMLAGVVLAAFAAVLGFFALTS
jgi:type VI secretion system protein ImpK